MISIVYWDTAIQLVRSFHLPLIFLYYCPNPPPQCKQPIPLPGLVHQTAVVFEEPLQYRRRHCGEFTVENGIFILIDYLILGGDLSLRRTFI